MLGSSPEIIYSHVTLKGYFANSDDPDEMPHDAAFHQGLHYLPLCLCKVDIFGCRYFAGVLSVKYIKYVLRLY